MDGRSGSRVTRRGYLGLLGAVGLAGCSASDGERAGSEPTVTAAPLPESTPTPRDRRVAGSNSAAARSLDAPWYERTATTTLSPTGLTVAFHPRPTDVSSLVGGGRFVRPGTADGPARLVLELANTGESTVSIPHVPVPGRIVTPRGDARAFLLPVRPPDGGVGDGNERDRFWFDGYWRGRRRTGRERDLSIDPGELGSLGYVLVAGPEGPALPVGTYAFETRFGWTFTLGVWRTDAPGPADASRFAGADVPELPGDGATEWFHHADRNTAVYLHPSTEQVSLSDGAETLDAALFNHSSATLVGNPLAYELLKLHEGTWYPVVPDHLPDPGGHLPPGATLQRRFVLRHDGPTDPDDVIPVGHLGGGRYALRFGMYRPDTSRRYAALVDVEAPELELSPSPELRVDGEDTARPVGWLDPDGGLFDAVVTATRTGEPADRTVVAEQVMHDPILRNTISVFGPTTEIVELHTRDAIADQLLPSRGTLRVSLRGTVYELVRQDD